MKVTFYLRSILADLSDMSETGTVKIYFQKLVATTIAENVLFLSSHYFKFHLIIIEIS